MKPLIFFILFLMVSYNAFGISEQEIVNLIIEESYSQGIDPNLALAIARNESRFNNKAMGSLGEIGIFQLRPEYHKGNLRNPRTNIKLGIKYLSYVKDKCYHRYQDAWWICFNTGPNRHKVIKHPKKFQYYVRVRKQMQYLASGD